MPGHGNYADQNEQSKRVAQSRPRGLLKEATETSGWETRKYAGKWDRPGLSRISPLFSKLCTETHAARLPFSPHSLTTPYLLLGFLPRDALVHSAVMRLLSSVCLSVCLSVTFRYRDDIGWKSWKLIVRSISSTPSLFVAQRPST